MKADILVIGAGTAGLRTAVTAAQRGAKTVLVGPSPIAGTCLNTGCIPTKAMLHAADVFRTVNSAKEVGISAQGKVQFSKVMKRVQGIIHEGRSHAEKVVKELKNLTYIEGTAKFLSENVVEANHKRITADKIIIATGARPFVPPIPGLKDVPFLTNNEVVSLKKQPKKLTIIGGGYIACEFATFFSTLGTQVTILERAPKILPFLDDDARAIIEDSLKEAGVTIITDAATKNVSKRGKTYTCSVSGLRQPITSDDLLVAAGRSPNTDSLQLERAKVRTDARGFIQVNSFLRSSNKQVFAIGDVNGQSLFAHAAKRESWLVLEHLLREKNHRINRDSVPWVVFTHPAVAGVGKTESQLQKNGTKYSVLEAKFFRAGKARIIREDKGFVKIYYHEGSILGALVVGPDSENILHELVALKGAGKKAIPTLMETIHAHPTLSEVLENLRSVPPKGPK